MHSTSIIKRIMGIGVCMIGTIMGITTGIAIGIIARIVGIMTSRMNTRLGITKSTISIATRIMRIIIRMKRHHNGHTMWYHKHARA